MAERKTTLRRAPQRPALEALLAKDKAAGVSEEVLQEQRASFAYGNAPKGSGISKASARTAVNTLRLAQT